MAYVVRYTVWRHYRGGLVQNKTASSVITVDGEDEAVTEIDELLALCLEDGFAEGPRIMAVAYDPASVSPDGKYHPVCGFKFDTPWVEFRSNDKSVQHMNISDAEPEWQDGPVPAEATSKGE